MPPVHDGIEAIILAGGRGTRLASVLPDLPKAMAPVAGRPFLDYVLNHLARSSVVRHAVLALGYRADNIVDHLSNFEPPLPTTPVVETQALGTGGALLNALSATSGNSILVLNADSLAAIDLRALWLQHQSSGCAVTLSVMAVPDASRYGSVELDGARVRNFVEKRPGAGLVNVGIYLFERDALVKLPTGPSSLEQDILPQLVAAGQAAAFVGDGPFLDIGLPSSYALAADFLRDFDRSAETWSGEA